MDRPAERRRESHLQVRGATGFPGGSGPFLPGAAGPRARVGRALRRHLPVPRKVTHLRRAS